MDTRGQAFLNGRHPFFRGHPQTILIYRIAKLSIWIVRAKCSEACLIVKFETQITVI